MSKKRRHAVVRYGLRRLIVLVFSALLLSCTGCGTGSPPSRRPRVRPVWPKPPEQARIRYVGTVSTERDVTDGASLRRGFAELIFGKKQIGAMLAPTDVVVSPQGRVFVADSAGSVVHIMDLAAREYAQFSSLADGKTLQRPVALALADGHVCVVDSQLHEVCVFDYTGVFKFSFGSQHLARPAGIAYLDQSKQLCVSDAGVHDLKLFDGGGAFVRQIGSRGSRPGQFNFPTHLWIDRDGMLYVSDTLNYRIQVFSADGTFVRMFGGQGDRPGYFAHPAGVATDSFGNVYVVDRQFENVQIFDRHGQILLAFGQEGNDLGEFWLPAGLYVDGRNWIYVADTFNKRVQVFELVEVTEDGQ